MKDVVNRVYGSIINGMSIIDNFLSIYFGIKIEDMIYDPRRIQFYQFILACEINLEQRILSSKNHVKVWMVDT